MSSVAHFLHVGVTMCDKQALMTLRDEIESRKKFVSNKCPHKDDFWMVSFNDGIDEALEVIDDLIESGRD